MPEKKSRRKRDPINSQKLILDAACTEFSDKGFDGTRVDQIAKRSGINKQLIYHYFGNKETLFTYVLETAYQKRRKQESELQLDHLPANEAIIKLIDFTWHYYLENPEFMQLLNSENWYKAEHLKQSKNIHKINENWLKMTQSLIERGIKEKNVRSDIDPMQLNISISALCFFYFSNRSTLSMVYKKDLFSSEALNERLLAMKEQIGCWIKPITSN